MCYFLVVVELVVLDVVLVLSVEGAEVIVEVEEVLVDDEDDEDEDFDEVVVDDTGAPRGCST